MKIYIISRCKKPYSGLNFEGWSISENCGSGFYVKAVHAFFKKKEAKQYIQDNEDDEISEDVKIITFENK